MSDAPLVGIAVIGQELAQPALGPRRGGKHGRPIGLENGRDLVAAHAHHVTEEQHGALLVRQLRHGGLEVALTPRGRNRGEEVIGQLPMEGFPATLPAPDLVEATEANAAEEPGAQRPPVAAEGWSSLHQFEKGLLHRVLGGIAIPQHRVRKGVEPIGEMLIEDVKGFGREPAHPVRECVQLWVGPITRDGSSWVPAILLGIGVDDSKMNIIPYSVCETIDRSLEDPVIGTEFGRLVGGTFENLAARPRIRRLVLRAAQRAVRPVDRTIRRPFGRNRHAPGNDAIPVDTRVGTAPWIKHLIGHPTGDACPVDYVVDRFARSAPPVIGRVGSDAGKGNAPSIHDPVGEPTGGRWIGSRTVTGSGMGIAPALP